jgi:hypothetical protein
MTIAVAIRTGSTVVFAADSKVTVPGVVGIDADGNPRWDDQTYDNATKVVHDRSRTLMAMVAGYATIGQIAATDFIAMKSLQFLDNIDDQDKRVDDLVEEMFARKRAYWQQTQVAPEKWPGPTVLLAAPSVKENLPRVWRADLEGESPKISEILTEPGINLEGAYAEVFSLLYGYHFEVLSGFSKELNITKEMRLEAFKNMKVLRPIDKLNLWAMPVQDAIDMAVFLARVQVEMDRFLPGNPACGGPIDVMVLQMAPEPGIVTYPGKKPHHPQIIG